MTWATKRKLTYIGIVFGIFFVVAGLVIYKYTSVPPTCFDGKKNADETGTDCGGGCSLYCANELVNPKVRWVRAFQVVPGVYHVVAYIEHNNPGAAAMNVSYTFKLYDEKNTLIAEQPGATFIGAFGRTAIVETLVRTGNVVPAVTRFDFETPIAWNKISPDYAKIVINTDRYVFDRTAKGSTRLLATLENKSDFSFTNLDTVAILYDKDDNALTAVKVLVPSLLAKESKVVYFTWPFEIANKVVRVEILPRVNPFTAVLTR